MWVRTCDIITLFFSLVCICRFIRMHTKISHHEAASASISNNLLDKPHPDVVRSNTENLRVAPVQERLEYAMA